jgi:hypothetical protein
MLETADVLGLRQSLGHVFDGKQSILNADWEIGPAFAWSLEF